MTDEAGQLGPGALVYDPGARKVGEYRDKAGRTRCCALSVAAGNGRPTRHCSARRHKRSASTQR